MKESSVDRILSEKLKAFREMQVTKFKFQKWKEYYLSRKIRILRILNFIESTQNTLQSKVFYAWKDGLFKFNQQLQKSKKLTIQHRISHIHHKKTHHIYKSFLNILTSQINAKKNLSQLAHKLHFKNILKSLTNFKQRLKTITERDQSKEQVFSLFYIESQKKRILDAWHLIAKISADIKRMQYCAFNNRRISLQSKAFLALQSHSIYSQTLRSKASFLTHQKQMQLKDKYLKKWIRTCVVSYQASQKYVLTLQGRGLQALKCWKVVKQANRKIWEQAESFDEYRKIKKGFYGWRILVDRKLQNEQNQYQFQAKTIFNWMRTILFEWRDQAQSQKRKSFNSAKALFFQKENLLKPCFLAWKQRIEESQLRYLTKIRVERISNEQLEKKSFQGWMKVLERRRVKYEKQFQLLDKRNRQIMVQVLQSLLANKRQAQEQIESAVEYFNEQLQMKVFSHLANFSERQKNHRFILTKQEQKLQKKVKDRVFYAWKSKMEKNRVKRCGYKLCMLYERQLYLKKSFRGLIKHQVLCTKFQVIKNEQDEKQVRRMMNEWKKSYCLKLYQNHQNKKVKLKCMKIFKKWWGQQQYKTYCIRYMGIRQSKNLMEKTIKSLIIYSEYQKKKQLMEWNMLQLHYISYGRKVLGGWKQIIRRKQDEQEKLNYLQLSNEFRLKKRALKQMMLNIVN